jgi:hypothetical protein
VSVQRFRSFEDARRALWADPKDPALLKRIARLWSLSSRLVPRHIPRGLRRFRTIEEANRERDAWVQQRIDRPRAERSRA